ncbi:hypothetical protein [Streptomyces sp. NPDC005438]|uniref:hypothetical protein n=1 Tax=Streptomyces sp. NPDC005438 TaxID=3156880 RepID=UPI0033A52D67
MNRSPDPGGARTLVRVLSLFALAFVLTHLVGTLHALALGDGLSEVDGTGWLLAFLVGVPAVFGLRYARRGDAPQSRG